MQKFPDPEPEGCAWLEPVTTTEDETPILADLAAAGLPFEAVRRDLSEFLGGLAARAAAGNGRAGVADIASLARGLRTILSDASEAAAELAEALSGADARTRARLELLGWDDARVRAVAAALDTVFLRLSTGIEGEHLAAILPELAELDERQRALISRQSSADDLRRGPALWLVHRLRNRWQAVHGERPRRKAFAAERERRSDGTPRPVGMADTVTPAEFGVYVDRLCALRAMAPLAELLANDFALSGMLRDLDENEQANRSPRTVTR